MTEVVAPPPQGTPCWVSLLVRNLPAAQDFYSNVFGWSFRPGPRTLGPYSRAVLGDCPVAGIGSLPEARRLPITWTTYMASDSADTTAELIRESGGTVAVGPLDADDAGRMAIASDPWGAVFGIWEPLEHVGALKSGRPGTVAWNELITRDSAFVDGFYSSVFGFETGKSDDPESERLTLYVKGQAVAGISNIGEELPPDRGPYWMTYFSVPDTDAVAQRVLDLGGRMVTEPRDTRYGRQATFTDLEGAIFSIIKLVP